jgi:hypothetical protein
MTSFPSRHATPCGSARARRLPALAAAVAALLALLVLAAPPAGAQQASAPAPEAAAGEDSAPRFFQDLDDLPLMAGLQEMPEASMSFDKPGGRIGEVFAEGGVPAETVAAFYADTLPEFGWEPVGENRYRRDGESLELEISEAQGLTTLRISLSPTE